jgi:hypothetical protein
MNTLELWILFFGLAVICFVIGVSRSKRAASRDRTVLPGKGDFAVATDHNDVQLLDHASVSKQLAGLRNQPASVVSYTLEQILQRWVINQDDKTAASRARFVKSKVEELKLMLEGQQIMVNLEALALEREKRLKTLQLENAQLDDTISRRGERERLLALKEQKQLEFDIAEIEDRIAKLKSPPKVEPEFKLSAEQQRRLKRLEIEDKLRELDRLEDDALKSARSDEDSVRIKNMHANKREELREQLSKFLV